MLLSTAWLERLRNSGRLGVGVSGGSDSVALACLCAEAGLPAVLLHMNYGLRGAESDEDERFVRGLGQRLGYEVLVERVKPADPSEETLRDLRYRWFATCPADTILTAHTLDDQAETVLFRLVRGTGPAGLAGILPESKEKILRPLLDVSRGDLRTWLSRRGMTWREDSSNQDTAYRRNWIRHELLPLIRKELNPEVDLSLSRLSRIVADDEEWLGPLLAAKLDALVRREAGGQVLNCAELGKLSTGLQRRVLRMLLQRVRGNLRGLDFQHVEAILGLCQEESATGRLQVPGLDALRSFDWLLLMRMEDLAQRPERNYRFPLYLGERITIPEQGGELTATLCPAYHYNEGDSDLDWDRLQPLLHPGQELELRNWRPGDRLLLRAMPEAKKLKELFQNQRIPLWRRRTWPIVVVGDEPVWAGEFGPVAAIAAGAETRIALRIQWMRAPDH